MQSEPKTGTRIFEIRISMKSDENLCYILYDWKYIL